MDVSMLVKMSVLVTTDSWTDGWRDKLRNIIESHLQLNAPWLTCAVPQSFKIYF